jgi:alkylhydroperoxidase family enzyme
MTINGDAEATQFLYLAAVSDAATAIFDQDVSEVGFIMNASRLWAYQPDAMTGLFHLMRAVVSKAPLSMRQVGILTAAGAAAMSDSCCSLAWGTKLAEYASPELAAGVLAGTDTGLSQQERAMARWARQVARDPNGTTPADVQALRDTGFSDADIFAVTVYVALRIAFSTVNDALGTRPDAHYARLAPPAVLDAVTFGRPVAAAAEAEPGAGSRA